MDILWLWCNYRNVMQLQSCSYNLSEFIIPSTGTSDPTPQKLQQPQSIFFRGCFTTWLKWQGLSFSPWLILTCRLCFPFTKKWHSSEKKNFFTVLYWPRLAFFAYANLFFIIFWVNSSFFVGFLAFWPASINRCLTVAELTCAPKYAKSFCNSKLLFREFLLLFSAPCVAEQQNQLLHVAISSGIQTFD